MVFLRWTFISTLLFSICSCSLFGKAEPESISAFSKTGGDSGRDSGKSGQDKALKGEINVHITADRMLNRFQDKPYALNICIYQLKDPNSFNQMTEERDGLSRLMQCSRFDSSVANAKRVVIQPGGELRDVRERAEGARYIGVVAGYYSSGKKRVSGILQLPSEKGGSLLDLELGSAEITDMRLKR